MRGRTKHRIRRMFALGSPIRKLVAYRGENEGHRSPITECGLTHRGWKAAIRYDRLTQVIVEVTAYCNVRDFMSTF